MSWETFGEPTIIETKKFLPEDPLFQDIAEDPERRYERILELKDKIEQHQNNVELLKAKDPVEGFTASVDGLTSTPEQVEELKKELKFLEDAENDYKQYQAKKNKSNLLNFW